MKTKIQNVWNALADGAEWLNEKLPIAGTFLFAVAVLFVVGHAIFRSPEEKAALLKEQQERIIDDMEAEATMDSVKAANDSYHRYESYAIMKRFLNRSRKSETMNGLRAQQVRGIFLEDVAVFDLELLCQGYTGEQELNMDEANAEEVMRAARKISCSRLEREQHIRMVTNNIIQKYPDWYGWDCNS